MIERLHSIEKLHSWPPQKSFRAIRKRERKREKSFRVMRKRERKREFVTCVRDRKRLCHKCALDFIIPCT